MNQKALILSLSLVFAITSGVVLWRISEQNHEIARLNGEISSISAEKESMRKLEEYEGEKEKQGLLGQESWINHQLENPKVWTAYRDEQYRFEMKYPISIFEFGDPTTAPAVVFTGKNGGLKRRFGELYITVSKLEEMRVQNGYEANDKTITWDRLMPNPNIYFGSNPIILNKLVTTYEYGKKLEDSSGESLEICSSSMVTDYALYRIRYFVYDDTEIDRATHICKQALESFKTF